MSHERSTSSVRDAATNIIRRLVEEGFTAYFAGGCVRDELLGLHPQDYDVATEAKPDDVRRLFRHTNEVGAVFGVMLVRTEGFTIEVATFREEGDYSDRRRPDKVHFTNAEHDAERRDFTINALFLDPLEQGAPDSGVSGVVHDYVGGLADLRNGVVRAVGRASDRLAEDHLRGLRGIRFAARLGFKLDSETAKAIGEDASELAGVSRERIGHEIRRMLSHPSRASAVEMLESLGLAATVLDDDGEKNARSALDVLASLPEKSAFVSALAAWQIDRGAFSEAARDELVLRLRSALCLTNEERDLLRNVFRGIVRVEREWRTMGIAQRKRAASSAWFSPALEIIASTNPELAASVRENIQRLSQTPSGLAPIPLINGDDLEAEGYSPGPEFSIWLTQIYDAQLEDRIHSRSDAIDLLRSLAADR